MRAGLLDTSVVIDLHDPVVAQALPDETAVSAVTLAELAAGPHLATDPVEAARRQAHLQQVEASYEAIPFGAAAARSYGLLVGAVVGGRRSHRRRIGDLLIVATAHAEGLALYTRNADDLRGLEEFLEIVTV